MDLKPHGRMPEPVGGHSGAQGGRHNVPFETKEAARINRFRSSHIQFRAWMLPADFAALKDAATAIDVVAPEFVRQAIAEKIERLEGFYQLKYLQIKELRDSRNDDRRDSE